MSDTTNASVPDTAANNRSVSPASKGLWIFAGVAGFLTLFYIFCGFYSVQPIGALPEGATAIVWRGSGEPFFNSPDALCLERMGGVSLMCRGMAMGQAPIDRIILRLPYQGWAYSLSTDGQSFDR